ncbi:MAG: tRNA 2-thiocytidine(32) synthetase TtcA, partial [Candidatus Omnitrophica bacterium]|nr:tRNA 2-thiocytidine(32) synthetase TtcA [Candidatus Omnitrophota bacterium]
INCFWCSWNRRRELFLAADKFGCTKVALGHHMDDIIETTLMNLFFQGEFSTMVPKQELFKGKIVIIRPLAYVEEDMIAKFVKAEHMKVFGCKCPHSNLSQREMMSRIIKQVKKTCPDVKKNIFRSLRRIKKDYLL